MTVRARYRGLRAAAALAVMIGLAGCGEDESSGSGEPEPAGADSAAAIEALPSPPSAFARRTLGDELVSLYRGAGDQLGLDWAVIAAVDQLEGATAGDPVERIPAIAYALQSFGAPTDYRVALVTRGGTGAFARDVLGLADRYRAVDAGRIPAGRLPLQLPAEGTVIAPFGQRLGVLHDGIDIDAQTGTPVRAAADGLVVSAGFHRIFGEYTCVLHRLPEAPPSEGELTTCYGNQSTYSISPGDRVAAGEQIGEVGCTGTCVRPHVHFQVRLGHGVTAPVADPARFLGGGVEVPPGGTPLEAG